MVRRSHGYSVLEMMMVVAIAIICATFGVMSLQPALKQNRVTNGYNTALMTLRRAREAAIAERRVYMVTFTAPRTVSITQTATGIVTFSTTLPTDIAFDAEPGIPNTAATTPDGFGLGPATGAIDFDVNVGTGGANTVYFYPDGSARDVNNIINNGVVYVARPGELTSSRAITVWGLTGRIRGWRIYQNASAGTYYWGQQ
jgi:Tfp pilus assembly protein FimT